MKTRTLTHGCAVAALFVLVSLLSGQKLEAQERVKIKTEGLTQDQLQRSSAPAPRLRSLTTDERLNVAKGLLTKLGSSPPTNPTLGNSVILKPSTPKTDKAWMRIVSANWYEAGEDYIDFGSNPAAKVWVFFNPPTPGKYMFDFNVQSHTTSEMYYTISAEKEIKFATDIENDHLVVVVDVPKGDKSVVMWLRADDLRRWFFHSCEITQIK